jgi:hypothetical protein
LHRRHGEPQELHVDHRLHPHSVRLFQLPVRLIAALERSGADGGKLSRARRKLVPKVESPPCNIGFNRDFSRFFGRGGIGIECKPPFELRAPVKERTRVNATKAGHRHYAGGQNIGGGLNTV